jgi:SAM-dependent methyltransferase
MVWRAVCADPSLAHKFCDIPDIVESWLASYGGLAGRDILDFGCGFGETAAGIALTFNPNMVVGVDIQDKPLQCQRILAEQFGMAALPAGLAFAQIDEGGFLGNAEFDLVISWSVLEHVRRARLRQTVTDLWAALRPGGLAFVQISPLYFSPEGSHLWALGYSAWEHLLKQTSEVMADIEGASGLTTDARDRLVRLFSTLNRVTAGELRKHFETAGFEVVREQRDRTETTPPPSLAEAYCLDALTTFQVVLLLRKPVQSGLRQGYHQGFA